MYYKNSMYKNSVYYGDGGTTRYNAPHIALNKIKITISKFFNYGKRNSTEI